MRISHMVAAGALALVLASAVSSPARADSKDEFKKGCEQGGGSYGETVDGVFCNSSGGVHIACDDKITHCTASSGLRKRITIVKPTIGTLRSYMAPGSGAPAGKSRVNGTTLGRKMQ